MGRPELGSKFTCTACSERFYDLNRTPAICPKCAAEQPPEKPRVYRPLRGAMEMRRQPRQPEPVAADEDGAIAIVADVDDDEEPPETDIDDDEEIVVEVDGDKSSE